MRNEIDEAAEDFRIAAARLFEEEFTPVARLILMSDDLREVCKTLHQWVKRLEAELERGREAERLLHQWIELSGNRGR